MGIFDIFKRRKVNVAKEEVISAVMSSLFHPGEKKTEEQRIAESQAHSEQFRQHHEKEMSKVDSTKWIAGNEDLPLENKEVLFLRYIGGKSTDLLSYLPGYWTHEYHLDYDAVIKKLFRGGYIEFASVGFMLNKQKVPELKEFLTEHGLPTKGKKADLVTRILDNISAEECIAKFPEKFFTHTEKARVLADKADFLHYFQNSRFGIPIDEAQRIMDKHPGLDQYGVATLIIENRAKKELASKNWGLWRNCLLHMSQVYEDQEQHQEALKKLFQVFWVDLSGLDNNDTVSPKNTILIAPGIVGMIGYNAEQLGMKFEDLQFSYIQQAEATKLPHTYYSASKTWQMLLKELNAKN